MSPAATPHPYVLAVHDLRVRFRGEEGDLPAVDGVTFNLARGRILALVGESGCGKSVTSYAILRLVQPPGRIAGGRIVFHPAAGPAVDVTALTEQDDTLYRLRGGSISMIFQEPMTALSPVHTIGDQICEGIRLHRGLKADEARARAAALLGEVGIPGAAKRLDQYPFELSGGMRQRAMIAMALACEPELLIADEPTTALDVTIQAQILRLIGRIQAERNMSVLLITHDLGVVAQTAHEVAVMYLGRIVEHGDVRTVLKSPAHPYTRALLKSLPASHKRGERLASIRGSVPALTDIPPGCPFHPRCPLFTQGLCEVGDPPDCKPLVPGHRVACHVAHAVRTDRRRSG